jgi:gentisate 1,2-dioxygenase
MEMKSGAVVRNAQERQDFYGRIGQENLAPLWEVLKGIVPSQPSPLMVPYLWDFDALKKFVIESGGLLTAEGPNGACWCWRTRPCAASR